MGKVQSKHGECFLVNAPLNPLCQPDLDEDVSSLKTVNYVSRHKNSSLLFQYQSDDAMQKQIGLKLDKANTLREVLPSGIASIKDKPNPSEQERREKEEKISRCTNDVSRDLSVEDLEKQEFCFTLYKFNGHKNITKDDTEGLVQSIHDALGNSIRLPPSGSRTVKVKLAVSPNSASSEEKDDVLHWKDKTKKKPVYVKKMGNALKQSSINLSCSSPEKESSKRKCHDVSSETANFLRSSSEVKPNICFLAAPKFKQGCWSNSLQRRRVSLETACLDCPDRHGKPYGEERQHKQHRRHRRCCRNHLSEICVHHDNYLNKNACEKLPHGCCDSFSYGMCDKNHLNRQAPSHQEDSDCVKKLGNYSHQKSKSYDANSTLKLSQNLVFSDQKDNLSNVNSDLCGLFPEKKFNWEQKITQKWPESFGMYDHSKSGGVNSPKIQIKTNSGVKATGSEPQVPPNHHHKHKHREYQKMQTMQQVADQLESTHLGVTSKENGSSNTQSVIQRYHHFHEHVHHHYYHYLPS
ncbi:protein naked cuticle homolog 2-like isoform X2 [Limulus polyphemus]|uniref:Protein naked cuticle homolog n=1 Tax=Limulus polyphemus TaxID=6850 RepID=A0ABM1SM47_LIMPO|nr:protein naked cuticle homolog 2-like isoform X2 [Limulus polyphemus]